MFDSTKEDLKDILRKIHKGGLQLPEFQRDYVWGEDDVVSLVASIAKGFPVGALLTLEAGGEVKFKPRLLSGVEITPCEPDEFLLDGQQRLTSLYQTMFSRQPLRTLTRQRSRANRYFYIDIKRAVESSMLFEDAIKVMPAERIERANSANPVALDLSTRQAEFEHDMFPLNLVFDGPSWSYDWRNYWHSKGRDVTELDRQFFLSVIETITRYEMPIIRLDKRNSREGICLVFEKVNVGGKKLDVFELVTAIYAADKYDLREDWEGRKAPAGPGRKARMMGLENRRDVLTQVSSTDFLQACTLLHTRDVRLARYAEGVRGKELPQVSCRRDALLGLPLSAFQKWAPEIEEGFIHAGGFLNEQKIIWYKDVPYPTLIVGLAAVFATLGKAARTAVAKEKLAQWFWSVTLGELYGSTTESRLARDVPELVEWISGGASSPRSLGEALFQRDRLHSLQSRISAAYKGIHALLMRRGCRDFISGRAVDLMTFFNDDIDIHHVFPQHWCKNQPQPIKPSVFNSIINKTPLSKYTNIVIGGDAPSVYLKKIERQQGISSADLDNILRTHLIEPEHLRNDDFEAFYEARRNALAGLVSSAMGKPVIGEDREPEAPDIEDDEVVDEPEAELETA